MGGGQTRNSALTTTLAFHYQVLVGLEQCFNMLDDQSIWFEQDGDVSLVGNSSDESTQIEIKNYADTLTDHHENFWKTLKNWLAIEFIHENYSALVLHTTQAFGVNSSFKNWNQKSTGNRLQILKDIFKTRSSEELTVDNPKPIVKLQKTVMETPPEKLKAVIAKVVLFTEADDKELIRLRILNHLTGIPRNNQESYLHGIIGFVYENSSAVKWEIKKSVFKVKCEELTSTYCRRQFTLPEFTGRDATEEELMLHEDKLFVQKIQCIEYNEAIPEAIGNWIELHNSLSEELDGSPQFLNTTNWYQSQLIKSFKHKHGKGKRNCTDVIRDS